MADYHITHSPVVVHVHELPTALPAEPVSAAETTALAQPVGEVLPSTVNAACPNAEVAVEKLAEKLAAEELSEHAKVCSEPLPTAWTPLTRGSACSSWN